MDLLPSSREFETICHKSFFSEDFEGTVLFFSQLLAGSRRGNVRSFQPDFISFVVIMSIRSFFVVKCLHHLSRFGQCGLCFGSGFFEVINEVLSCLALDFATGFKSLVGVSSVVQEKR